MATRIDSDIPEDPDSAVVTDRGPSENEGANILVAEIDSGDCFTVTYEIDDDDLISRLPKETMVKILSHVSMGDLTKRVTFVSRLFRDRAHDPSLWTRLPISLRKVPDLNMFGVLFERCTMLKGADLCVVGWRREKVVSALPLALKVLDTCNQLTELKVTVEFDYDMNELLKAIGSSSSLEKLELIGQWNPETLSKKAASLGRLKDLTLATRDGSDRRGLMAIGRHCQRLKNFAYFSDQYVWHISDAAIISFLKARKDTLQKLSLYCPSMNDAALAGLVHCKHLHTLHLDKSRMTGKILSVVAQLSGLRNLILPNLWSVETEHFIRAFESEKLQNLTSLTLYDNAKVNDHVLAVIAENCPNLTHLNLSNYYPEVAKSYFHECLSIRFGGDSGKKITDVGLKKILEECKVLEELGLELVSEVTSGAFISSSLRKLSVYSHDSHCIGRDELAKIKKLWPRLLIRDSATNREWNYEAHKKYDMTKG